ncbi:MAG: polymer-forming cytoskeletal protein [Candidatus Acidiferrales bacterium]
MWSSKQPDGTNPGSAHSVTPQSAMPQYTNPNYNPHIPAPAPEPFHANEGGARPFATLGPGLTIKGQISGEEDLRIDGKVEGGISLKGQRLTIGQNGEIVSDVHAREVIVYGRVRGNLHAGDRVEVKKDGSVVGNITAGRILIEDGAYLKGQIEIERNGKSKQHAVAQELETVGAASGKGSY